MARGSRLADSDADAIAPVVIGTVAWAAALVVLLLVWPRLVEGGTTWWVAVAGIGLLSGLIGLAFLRWRRRRHASRGADAGQE